MRILLLGSGSRFEVCKEALENANHEMAKTDFDGLIAYDYDLIVLANYSQILPKESYSNVKYGAICCHGGRLPQYRGSSVLNWQIINNEVQGGISIIQIDEGIDTGDILGVGVFDIEISDTIIEVRKKANEAFQRLLPRIVMQIENHTVKKVRQHDIPTQPCYYHHRKPEDSKIDWKNMTALQVYNLVRACESPYEAYCHTDNIEYAENIVTIKKARLVEDNFCGILGRVVRHMNGGSVVICKDRGVWIDVNMPIGDNLC
jgi:methionyl-tRNA formyltransferase